MSPTCGSRLNLHMLPPGSIGPSEAHFSLPSNIFSPSHIFSFLMGKIGWGESTIFCLGMLYFPGVFLKFMTSPLPYHFAVITLGIRN